MLLPYRVKVSDTKVTHFTPILALWTCLYRSHLRKPVLMKQTKHSRKSKAQNLCSKCPPFMRTHAFKRLCHCEVVHVKLWKSVNICKSYSKKNQWHLFSGHGVDYSSTLEEWFWRCANAHILFAGGLWVCPWTAFTSPVLLSPRRLLFCHSRCCVRAVSDECCWHDNHASLSVVISCFAARCYA